MESSIAPPMGGQHGFPQFTGTLNALFSVSFVGANIGTAVGDLGTIVHTTNGGSTWVDQASGTTALLYGVSFTDANTGTAVGGEGTIRRTTDGGTTWSGQTSGTTNPLLGVSFSDANNGTAVGTSGTIMRTTNGGTTWAPQTSGTTNTLQGVLFTDANNGTTVGNLGTIRRTTNGGTTWTPQTSGTTNTLNGVDFTDPSHGVAVGDGEILLTTNGGTTWDIVGGSFGHIYYSVSFSDHDNGTTVGSEIRRTSDGGQSWTLEPTITIGGLYGVAVPDAEHATGVGTYGTILHRIDPPVPPPTSSYYFFAGWNLVSVPLSLLDYSTSAVFPTAVGSIFKYANGYTSATVLENGPGYWAKFGADELVDMIGYPRTSDTISISEGWNLIGSISNSVLRENIIEDPPGIIEGEIFGYDANGYFIAPSIEPSQAYWLKGSQAGNIILPVTVGRSPSRSEQKRSLHR
ncbi:MAG: WD40/YVTN/BNR-like repeat-containing protein [Bacteroidota bacterium]